MKKFPSNYENILPMEEYLTHISHYTFIDSCNEEFDTSEDDNYLLDRYLNSIILAEIEAEYDKEIKNGNDLNETEFVIEYDYSDLIIVLHFQRLFEWKGFQFSFDLLTGLLNSLDTNEQTKLEILNQTVQSDIVFLKFQKRLRNITEFPITDYKIKELFYLLSDKERKALQLRG